MFLVMDVTRANSKAPKWGAEAAATAKTELVAMYGEEQNERIERGVDQVLSFWRDEDGSAAEFHDFIMQNFAGSQDKLDEMFTRYQWVLEQLDGHMNEITLAMRRQVDEDLGEILPFDEVFAGYDPSAHISDDFFANKLAFVVLLNFPLTTLQERLEDGPGWSRRQWAEVRLAQRFSRRIPAEVNQAIAEAAASADNYISQYNIWMYHLLDANGDRLFPPKMCLLSHTGIFVMR